MISNLQLGDWYYTIDDYDEVAGYLFIARQGQFIIGAPEYYHCAGNAVDQLHEMCDETLSNDGVGMYVHLADKCYSTLEEAEKHLEDNE